MSVYPAHHSFHLGKTKPESGLARRYVKKKKHNKQDT